MQMVVAARAHKSAAQPQRASSLCRLLRAEPERSNRQAIVNAAIRNFPASIRFDQLASLSHFINL
jgi:hypothetical protein